MGLENPYSAAQRFLQNNELPLTYIDEVVKFIEKNTAGVNIGTGGEEYVDPYTGKHTRTLQFIHVHDKILLGASRYRSSAGPAPGSAPSQYADPFTGGSRYVAGQSPTLSAPSTQSHGDPFTGASRYTSPTTAPAVSAKILPVVRQSPGTLFF